jgi:hypothetical protein
VAVLIIMTMIGIGLAFSIRIGGLILFGFTPMFVFFAILMNDEWRKHFLALDFKYYGRLIAGIGGASSVDDHRYLHMASRSAVTYRPAIPRAGCAVAVPYGHAVLYDGKAIGSNEVPPTYIPFYIINTSPVIVIIGIISGIGYAALAAQNL